MPDIMSLKFIIILWQAGLIDGLTLSQFCLNFCAQYTTISFAEGLGNAKPTMFLAPLQGIGTAARYIQMADGWNTRRKRIATVAVFAGMSGTAITTDVQTSASAGGTVAAFISHMKFVINKTLEGKGNGLVFVNPKVIGRYSNNEIIAYQVTIIGGGISIILIIYLASRILKISWNFSKRLTKYSCHYSKIFFEQTLTFSQKRLENRSEIKRSKKIRAILKKSFKQLNPLKYVGFLERKLIKTGKIGFDILIRNKISN